MKAIIVSLALIVCWVSCAPLDGTTTRKPFVKLSCKGHKPDGFFVDEKDSAVFHQCSHGQHIATFHCQNSTIFNETAQVCVRNTKIVDAKCPEPEGLFPFPGNPHKFINCNGGHAFITACAADLIFDETKKECVYNDKGLTWDTDAPTVPTTPSKAPTEPTKATEAPTQHPTQPPTQAPTQPPTQGSTATENTSAKPECEGKGSTADPDDKTKYFICHNGKKIHANCPEGTEFDPVIKQCS